MANIASDTGGGGDFKPVPSGNHVGICSMVVGLGKQRIQSAMYGESVKSQIYVAWELPHETIEWTDKDGNQRSGPMRIGKTYTMSLHENAALRADLERWRGRAFTEEERRGFDVNKLAGAPAMVNVLHADKNGKTYANVAGVTPLPKGMEKPTLSGSALIYDDDEFSGNYDLLPEWLQKKIDAQVKDEPAPTNTGHGGAYDDLDDDVPF
jgi:hypothetical protein